MPEFLHPGVFVSEIPFETKPIEGVSTSNSHALSVLDPGVALLEGRAALYQRLNVSVPGTPAGCEGAAQPNREFDDLWLRFVCGVARFARQNAAPAQSRDIAHRVAGDLADAVTERIAAIAQRDASGQQSASVQIAAAAGARDLWQVLDRAVQDLNGAANTVRQRTLAQAGGTILSWLAAYATGPSAAVSQAVVTDAELAQAAQQWLAAASVADAAVEAFSGPAAAGRVAALAEGLVQALGLGGRSGMPAHQDVAVGAPPSAVALFQGASGTGKTLAAHLLASALGSALYRVDLSQVVSKTIGETEKNLDVLFKRAEQSGAVLFVDEADALFGKRTGVKDAHDRFANQQVNYLLERIERYEGVAILATNSRAQIDPDVLKRARAVVAFPIPVPPKPGRN